MKFFVFATLLFSVISVGAAMAANPTAIIETSMGTIKIELFEDKAPITVKNFLDYVDAKHYDGTIFHRVKPDFMIQGGGFDADMTERKTKATIKNESTNGLSNVKGTLAMARRPDPDSASSQFFINVKDNDFLDKKHPRSDGFGYCVFGKVTDGMDVVEKIKVVKTARKGIHDDVPVEAVTIKSVKRGDAK